MSRRVVGATASREARTVGLPKRHGVAFAEREPAGDDARAGAGQLQQDLGGFVPRPARADRDCELLHERVGLGTPQMSEHGFATARIPEQVLVGDLALARVARREPGVRSAREVGRDAWAAAEPDSPVAAQQREPRDRRDVFSRREHFDRGSMGCAEPVAVGQPVDRERDRHAAAGGCKGRCNEVVGVVASLAVDREHAPRDLDESGVPSVTLIRQLGKRALAGVGPARDECGEPRIALAIEFGRGRGAGCVPELTDSVHSVGDGLQFAPELGPLGNVVRARRWLGDRRWERLGSWRGGRSRRGCRFGSFAEELTRAEPDRETDREQGQEECEPQCAAVA